MPRIHRLGVAKVRKRKAQSSKDMLYSRRREEVFEETFQGRVAIRLTVIWRRGRQGVSIVKALGKTVLKQGVRNA